MLAAPPEDADGIAHRAEKAEKLAKGLARESIFSRQIGEWHSDSWLLRRHGVLGVGGCFFGGRSLGGGVKWVGGWLGQRRG